MKFFVLTKRSLLSLAFCLIIGALAATVAVSSAVKAVQTAAEPKIVPVYRVEGGKNQVAISFDAAWGDDQTEHLLNILDENDVKVSHAVPSALRRLRQQPCQLRKKPRNVLRTVGC